MRRDYRLYELHPDEFERLIVAICIRWLGAGVTPFAPGPDGGRDGKFVGRANCFPSESDPLAGHCVLQAKHVSAPDRSCSDSDFKRLLAGERDKIKKLVKAGLCDHYLVFTNRKLTGGADETLIAGLMKLRLKGAHIVGTERLHAALEDYADLSNTLPNYNDSAPFRFNPDELVEVIHALHDYTSKAPQSDFNSAREFDAIKIQQKNKLNDLSETYFHQMIVNNSMPHFPSIEEFLKNRRNRELADLYHDAADELKQKILTNRGKFGSFDELFTFLSSGIQQPRSALRGKRRLVSILLHYMYCNCDIGSKELSI